MVISFSDSMQLTFAARDRLIAGQDKYTAFRNAVLVVGPACVLTHGTAGISFIALQFSGFRPDPQIRRGGACRHHHRADRRASLVPVFGVLFVRNEKVFAAKFQGAARRRQRAARFLLLDSGAHVSRPGLFSLIAVILLAVWRSSMPTWSRVTGSPNQVRTSSRPVAASGRLDAKLTGANRSTS